MKNSPKLSVLCITYNHEKFIKQTLESFMMQKTDFDFEVIIGEDCSTDNTREIIKEFEQKYPKIIKPIYRDENIGAMQNSIDILYRANGDYIALCEGDDYWTDPLKLQKQVDFLESHEDYVICFHDAMTINEDNDVISKTYPNKLPEGNKSYYTVEDFITSPSNFIPTASIVFRNNAMLKKINEWNSGINLGDIFLIVSLCHHSDKNNKIKFINEVMSVYRIHKNGIYMGMSDTDKIMTSIFARIRTSRYFPQYHYSFDQWLERRLRGLIDSNIELTIKNRGLMQGINSLKQKPPVVPLRSKIIKYIRNVYDNFRE